MKVKKIMETCLYVTDLEQTRHFYHQLLGLPVISLVKNRHIFFRTGSSVLLCFISETTKNDTHLPPHYGSGHLHFALEVSAEAYDQTKRELVQKGIIITHEEIWRDGVKSFYFNDPDGHVVEVVPEGMWDY